MHPPLIRALALAIACLPFAAAADTVTVVTSFPKEITTAYKKAYEAKYPNDKVEILNKNTAAGIAYVREQAAGSRPEVFWASAPDGLALQGTMEGAEYLGEFLRYEIRVGEASVTADIPHARGRAPIAPGTPVALGVPATELRFVSA